MPPKPKGFPIATTQSPTLALSEFPNSTNANLLEESIFSTAKSAYGSEPRTLASYSLSSIFTIMSSAFAIT